MVEFTLVVCLNVTKEAEKVVYNVSQWFFNGKKYRRPRGDFMRNLPLAKLVDTRQPSTNKRPISEILCVFLRWEPGKKIFLLLQ